MDDNDYKGFLDDTSLSKTPKSPLKTSTVAKENVKGSNDAIRKKLSSQAFQSFFCPTEDTISALNEVTNVPKSIKKPFLQLMSDTSFASEGANSSLGILHTENFSDLTDSTLHLSLDSKRKMKSRKKSKKVLESNREDNTELKCIKIKQQNNSLTPRTVVDQLSVDDLEIKDHSGSSSSSDIEYDGTNIPELNLDFNEYLYSKAAKDETNEMPIIKSIETENFRSCDKYSCDGTLELQMNADELEDSRLSHRSIFENFQPSYDNIFQQLMMGKTANGNNKVEAPEKIKVCPFLDVSSFEIETMKNVESPQKEFQNRKQLSEPPLVEFCPEQISARSSSFRFSSKICDISSGVYCSDKKEQSCSSYDIKKMSLSGEGLKDEIVSGSFFKHMESISESAEESYKSHEAERVDSNAAYRHPCEPAEYQKGGLHLQFPRLSYGSPSAIMEQCALPVTTFCCPEWSILRSADTAAWNILHPMVL